MKKMIVLIVILLLLVSTIQVAFAEPPWDDPGNLGACNMGRSWWDPDQGDMGHGNAIGVDGAERGMYHVHNSLPHGESIGGANMWILTESHCGE